MVPFQVVKNGSLEALLPVLLLPEVTQQVCQSYLSLPGWRGKDTLNYKHTLNFLFLSIIFLSKVIIPQICFLVSKDL